MTIVWETTEIYQSVLLNLKNWSLNRYEIVYRIISKVRFQSWSLAVFSSLHAEQNTGCEACNKSIIIDKQKQISW